MTERNKGGRRTKAEELTEFAEANGIDPELVGNYIATALPKPKPPRVDEPDLMDMAAIIADPKQLYDWAVNELVAHVSTGKANVATVNGLKAVMDFATRQPDAPDEGDDSRMPLLERLDALPAEYAATLVRSEIWRLEAERDAYVAALAELEGADK